MGTTVVSMADYQALWDRRTAALEALPKLYQAWLCASTEAESTARWTVYHAALLGAGVLVLECLRMGEQLVQARGEVAPAPMPPLPGGPEASMPPLPGVDPFGRW